MSDKEDRLSKVLRRIGHSANVLTMKSRTPQNSPRKKRFNDKLRKKKKYRI